MANLTVHPQLTSTKKLRGSGILVAWLFRHWIGFSVPRIVHQSLIFNKVSLSAIFYRYTRSSSDQINGAAYLVRFHIDFP